MAGPDDWIDALVRAAERVGVAVRQASARDGILTLEVRGAEGASVGVDVLPRAPRERYHLATARFGLRHHGRAAPGRAEQATLEALARAIRAAEATLPALPAPPAPAGRPAAAGPAIFTVERSASVGGGDSVWTELLVRLTARCNQRCPFCSGPPDHPDADPGRVRAWLDAELPRHPRPTVTLTGGEPGLWPGLPDLVGHLVARPDVVEVRVQTNAVPFAPPGRAAAFAAGPRLRFFVSLHAARPDLYDLCTGTRGQLELAVAGVRNLLAAGHGVTLNAVANRHNADHLEAWASAAGELFPGPLRPRLHLSITMCPEHRPEAPDWLVRYTELAPRLTAAARRARALGLECEPLLASSHAAIPPCLLPPEERVRAPRADGAAAVPLLRPDESGAGDAARPWVRSEACLRCSEGERCLGVPRAYAARFGVSELRPLP